MTIDIQKLGNRIKSSRRKRGITQLELAELIDTTPTFISYIESGIRHMSLDTFVTIANALHVTADQLLQDHLEVTLPVSNHELSWLMSDCNNFERAVIADLIREVKRSLRANQPPRQE